MWEYDDGGNILSRKKYAYTTGNLGAPTETVNYGYGNANWGDLLTSYNGQNITYDTIGNVLSDGTRTYTWEHGRELTTLTMDGKTWSYTYDANGMRTKRAYGSTVYQYVYNGSQLSQMTIGSNTLFFTYDASGMPMTVTYNGTVYYYVTNLQGDVVAILNNSGVVVVEYTYDAWGNVLSTTGSLKDSLGYYNPLRYRGYVYDTETGLYYLQSRYYNPEWGRFINADGLISTGQGLLGNNMFAYCNNNPVNLADAAGTISYTCIGDNHLFTPMMLAGGAGGAAYPQGGNESYLKKLFDVDKKFITNVSEKSTCEYLKAYGFAFYKGVPVVSIESLRQDAFSFGIIFMGSNNLRLANFYETLKHEYGHSLQFTEYGPITYTTMVAIPSLCCSTLYRYDALPWSYYSSPWEYQADQRVGISRDDYTEWASTANSAYTILVLVISVLIRL